MEVIKNEKTAANTVEVEFKLNAEEFEGAVQKAYLRRRKNISLPGFRKGKAPRKMIETQYGENFFYEDAVNGVYQKALSDTIEELKLDVIDVANIEVVSIGKEEGVVFKAVFTTKPEVSIDGYLGLKIDKPNTDVTDEDIEKKLSELQQRNARIIDVTDRAVMDGDTVNFDFKGFCDDVAFEGGSAENYSLVIGSGQFIPGFEEQIIGHNTDEDFDVNVTFPEDYNAAELAGKDAVFKCHINGIKAKELTEIDDEFAKDVSEFDTLEELKKDLSVKIAEEKEHEGKHAIENAISEQLIEKLDAEIPEIMYESRIDDLVRDWEMRNRGQGIKVDDYLKFANLTMEQFRDLFKPGAVNQVKMRLALEKIAELENIEIDDARLDEEYASIAEQYKMEVDKIKMAIPAENLRKDLVVDKAMEIVKENAKITKPRARKKKAAETEE